MTTCSICGQPTNTAERAAAGRSHCTRPSCIAEWRRRRIADKGLVLVNPHKQGLTWVQRDESVVKNTGRRPA